MALRTRSIAILLVVTLVLSSCVPEVRKRPPGYVRLGTIDELQQSETFLPELRLLLRRDERGFYVMSTMCTSDLSTLEVVTENGQEFWYSRFSKSKYSRDGRVISGPARADLPFYDLVLDAALIGGPVNTLYARIGRERPRDWRLVIHEARSNTPGEQTQ